MGDGWQNNLTRVITPPYAIHNVKVFPIVLLLSVMSSSSFSFSITNRHSVSTGGLSRTVVLNLGFQTFSDTEPRQTGHYVILLHQATFECFQDWLWLCSLQTAFQFQNHWHCHQLALSRNINSHEQAIQAGHQKPSLFFCLGANPYFPFPSGFQQKLIMWGRALVSLENQKHRKVTTEKIMWSIECPFYFFARVQIYVCSKNV